MSSPLKQQGEPGHLVGVGVGPGDHRNMTLRALDTIRAADVVVAPCSNPDTEGRAEGIVRMALPEINCQRIVFDMSPGETGVEARSRGAKQTAANLVPRLLEGRTIAFVTLGDPNIFSTFSPIAREVARLAPEVRISTVPGIMAFQEVAALNGAALLDETEKLYLVTAFKGIEDVAESVRHRNAAVVIYKGGKRIGQIKDVLEHAGRLSGAVVGELLGLEGEQITMLEAVIEPEISYLATVIAPPLRD